MNRTDSKPKDYPLSLSLILKMEIFNYTSNLFYYLFIRIDEDTICRLCTIDNYNRRSVVGSEE